MSREQKKHTAKQKFAALEKQNQQLFSMMIQLSQEIQMIGGMSQTTLQVLKEFEGYEDAVEAMKAKHKEAEEAEAKAEEPKAEENNDLILD